MWTTVSLSSFSLTPICWKCKINPTWDLWALALFLVPCLNNGNSQVSRSNVYLVALCFINANWSCIWTSQWTHSRSLQVPPFAVSHNLQWLISFARVFVDFFFFSITWHNFRSKHFRSNMVLTRNDGYIKKIPIATNQDEQLSHNYLVPIPFIPGLETLNIYC